jgi:hypothetical protein
MDQRLVTGSLVGLDGRQLTGCSVVLSAGDRVLARGDNVVDPSPVSVEADENGTFEVTLWPGIYHCLIMHDGSIIGRFRFELTSDGPTDLAQLLAQG